MARNSDDLRDDVYIMTYVEKEQVEAGQMKVVEADAPVHRKFVRRSLRDTAMYLPATLVQGLGGIVVTSVISKLSTPADFGNYTLGVNLSMALAMLAGQWLNESLVRLIPEYQRLRRKPALYGSLLYAGAAITVGLAILTWLILEAFQGRIDAGLFPYLALAVGAFPLMVVFAGVRSWCRATGRSLAFSALVIWRIIGGVLLGLVFVLLLNMGTIGFLWGMVAAWSVVAAGFLVTRWDILKGVLPPRNFSGKIVHDALQYSLPLTGIAVSALVLSISDRYLIGGFLSIHAVGIYALGYAIAQKGMQLVTQTFSRAMQPVVFRAWSEEGPAATTRVIEQLSRYFALAAIPLATGLTVLSREIVILFSTAEYVDGAQVIGAVSAAMICFGYARIFGVGFALRKRTVPLLAIYLVTTAFNVMINVIGIPRYGYIVAAWSTLASYAMMMILTGLWSRHDLPLRVFGLWIWKPLAAAAGMAFVVSAMKPIAGEGLIPLIVEVIVGVVVYGVLLIAVRGVSMNELRSLGRMAKGRLRIG